MVTALTERVDSLEQKNTTLETTNGQMWWWIRLHDANISYLCNKVNPDIVRAIPVEATTSNLVNTIILPLVIAMLKENILIQNTSPQFNKNFIWYKKWS